MLSFKQSLCSITRSSSACSCRASQQAICSDLAINKERWCTRKSTLLPLHRRSHSNPPRLRYPFEYDSPNKTNPTKRYFTRYEREEHEEEEEEEAQEEDVEGELEHEFEEETDIHRADFSAIRDEFLAKSDVTRGAHGVANELNLEAESKYQKAMRERTEESESMKYRLESARPRATSEEEMEEENENLAFDVFEHYTMLHERRQTTVLPHLQPNMLRPFGATDTLIFPTNKPKRPKIKYPIYNTFETASDMHATEATEDTTKPTSQQREYSTLRKTESNQNNVKQKKGVAAAQSKVDVASKKQSSQLLTSKHSKKSFVPSEVSDKCRKPSNTKMSASKEVEKYNSIISEFKKVNPDAKLNKQELTPGSDEEKRALDKAIKFASKYREKFDPEAIVKDVEIEKKQFHHRENHYFLNRTWQEKFDMLHRKSRSTIKHNNNQEIIQTESPVEDASLKEVKLKAAPKLNVLQTSALPGESEFLDRASLEENEKLTPPWPAYSETVKGKPSRGSNFLISYPSVSAAPEANIRKFGTFSGRQHGTKKTAHIRTKNECPAYHMPSYKPFWRFYCSPSSRHPLGREGVVMPKLRRLPKVRVKEPKKVCPVAEDICGEHERADYRLRVKPKQLPILKIKDCPCREDPPLSEGEPLRRPQKTHEVHEDIREECPTTKRCGDPRADDGVVLVKPKKLPKLVPQECPCTTAEIEDTPPLKRLIPREVPIPPRICKPKVKAYCPPRADGKIVVKRKQLPILKAPDCPCVDETPSQDIKMPRLKKRKVKIPKRVCKKREKFVCPPRLDDVKKYKLKKKKLKTLVLREELNEVSIAEFNRRKGRRYHTQCNQKKTFLNKKYIDDSIPISTNRRKSDSPFGVYCGHLNIRRFAKNVPVTSQGGKHSTTCFCTLQAIPAFSNATAVSKIALLKNRNRGNVRNHSSYAPESRNAATIFKKLNDKFGNLNIYAKPKTRSTPIQAKDYFKVLDADMLSTRNRHKFSKERVTVDEVGMDTEGVYRILTDIGNRNRDIRPIIKKYFPSVQFSSNPCKTCASTCGKKKQKKSMWQKICDYFRARPNCPPPDEWKKKRLREAAEKAAAKAGLKICGPNCECIPKMPPCEKFLPTVITHKNLKCKPKSVKAKGKRCKQFKLHNCPARVRTTCEQQPPMQEKCTAVHPPYPSFTERHQPTASCQRMEECHEAEKRHQEVRELAEACCKKQPKRSFSTLGHPRRCYLGQQYRHLSSRTKYDDDDPYSFFKPEKEDDYQSMNDKELHRRILNAVKNRLEVLAECDKDENVYFCQEGQNNSMDNYFNKKLPISCTKNSSVGESGFLLNGDSIIKLKKPCDFLADIQKGADFANVLDCDQSDTTKNDAVIKQLDELLKNQ